MPDLTCGSCDATLKVADSRTPQRIKHNADGSHTVTPVTPAKAVDLKPRGRRRG